ncbi:starch-binding protein [Bacteroidia bacterium]|nr:starch-binding protein [Bacteroidia bacterium]
MKKIENILCIGLMMLFPVSCSDYLDVVPDNTLKLEDLFTTKEQAYNALAKVYNGLPREDNTHDTSWTLGDDFVGRLDGEVTMDENYLRAIRIMRGLQSATTPPSATTPYLGIWSGTGAGKNQYRSIRQADVFLSLIDNVYDMTSVEKADWKAQVTILKAYYCFLLVQRYGPIVLPTELATPDATAEQLFKPRSKVEECFDYILSLLDDATISKLAERATQNNLGQIDQVVARAIKAKILFFRASPFFNGNREYFGDFVDPRDDKPFFPLEYNKEKWAEAISAINDALAICDAKGVKLYHYTKEPFSYDKADYDANPNLRLLYDLRMLLVDPWNTELVWGFSGIDIYNDGGLAYSTNLRLTSAMGGNTSTEPAFAWNWLGASYQMAERYYTKNGVPITEDKTYDTGPVTELVTTPSGDPNLLGILRPSIVTAKFNVDREPRFYANLGITAGYWRAHSIRIPLLMYSGQFGGKGNHPTNFWWSGIGVQKFVHPENESEYWQRSIKMPYPLIRLADLLLMKAEALNEYRDAPNGDVYDAINLVRKRAGIPRVDSVWAETSIVKTLNKHTTKEGMREIILQERAVELAFEGNHYWDMIRHKKAPAEFSSPIWGWNCDGTTAQTFFVLSPIEPRKFTIKDCLWPISLNELNTNGKLIQNPGW